MTEHHITLRKAVPADLPRCIAIRGLTRDNPIPEDTLATIGVTPQSWQTPLQQGVFTGVVAEHEGTIIGYCFGDLTTGEVLVLALLPDYEGAGTGKRLLADVVDKLTASGHSEPWLAAAPEPTVRAHGFYRKLGWVPTGQRDAQGDEILKYSTPTQGQQK